MNSTRSPRSLIVEILPVVLALVLTACGGSDSAQATTTTAAAPTTTAPPATTSAPATTAAPVTTAPTTTAATAAADLPTELKAGDYLVGSQIAAGTWQSDECGCPWVIIDEMGNEVPGIGDDAVVPADAYEIRLGSCNWEFKG